MNNIILLITLSVIFAYQAVQSSRLITSALWLAGVSVLVSIVFYLFGAVLASVIELSVGAGLVTVLFVFAIAIAGEDPVVLKPLVSKVLAGSFVGLVVGLLSFFIVSVTRGVVFSGEETTVVNVMWNQRSLDVLVQIILIFTGVLGMLGLLSEAKAPLTYPIAAEFAARRERELELIEEKSMERES